MRGTGRRAGGAKAAGGAGVDPPPLPARGGWLGTPVTTTPESRQAPRTRPSRVRGRGRGRVALHSAAMLRPYFDLLAHFLTSRTLVSRRRAAQRMMGGALKVLPTQAF